MFVVVVAAVNLSFSLNCENEKRDCRCGDSGGGNSGCGDSMYSVDS